MERPRQHQVVVCRELAQPGLEVALVDESAGLVDDDERVHAPAAVQPVQFQFQGSIMQTYMVDIIAMLCPRTGNCPALCSLLRSDKGFSGLGQPQE